MAFISPWLAASIAATTIWLTVVIIRYLLSTQRPKDFPPGPSTLLGIGNLHQIPLKQPFLQFHEWSKTYGDIIGLKVGPANLVILHNPQYVRELFDKRSANYSGRPYSYIPVEHVFCEHRDIHILNLQNGPSLRRWRAAVAELIGSTGVKQSLPIQEATAASLVHRLLTTPSDFPEHFRHWALGTPLLAITGQRLENRGKAFSDRFFDAQAKWLELLEPGNAPPVDIFPFLRWIPERFADWKTKARFVREYMVEEYQHYFQTAKKLCSSVEGQKKSTHEPARFRCLMTKILEGDKEEKKWGKPFTADEVAYIGGGLLDAAVDTTWATIMSLIVFMATYPDIQAKAREEIDRVSPDMPPGGEVIGQLPYIQACLLETFRLRPPAPNGLPHVLDRDDIFQGYRIPKGTTLLANVWGIQRNPDDYDQPEKFLPERYLHNPFGLRPDVETTEGRRTTYTFGAGRRVCPGEQFAQAAILLAVSKLLWAFKIVAPEPLDLAVETGFHTGLVLSPKRFNVDFVLRDEKRREGIVLDYETSLSALEQISI